MAEQVERLSIRLVGHPSRQLALNPWNKCRKPNERDSDDDSTADPAGSDHWISVGPVVGCLERGKQTYLWHTEEHQLHPWRQSVNEKLVVLASALPNFKNLKDLSFEASSEGDGELGPRWDYLFGSTVEKFIQAVPTGLKSLTLDICGSTVVVSEHNRMPVHLCPLIACRLQDFERVRLRMRHICPRVYDNANKEVDEPSNLAFLVIRLSLPAFPEATYEKHDGYHEYDAQPCRPISVKLSPFVIPLVSEGISFAKTTKVDMMRISYRSPHDPDRFLYVADCVRESSRRETLGVCAHEDNGRQWAAWEDEVESVVGL